MTVDIWDAEQKAEELTDRAGLGRPFGRPLVMAPKLGYTPKPERDVRGCAGAMLVGESTILYPPCADMRFEGTGILHEIIEGEAPPWATHGDIWRINLAACATRSELGLLRRWHGSVTLDLLASYQPHIDRELLRLRLWMVRKFRLVQPRLPGV